MTSPTKVCCIFDLYFTLVYERNDNRFYGLIASRLGIDQQTFLASYKACGPRTMSGELRGMQDRVHAACIEAGIAVRADVVAAAVDELMPLWHSSIEIYDDTIKTLARLKNQQFRLGLLSNASSYSERVLTDFMLRPFFDEVLMSYACGYLKPQPIIYDRILKRLKVDASQCVYVGDGGDNELGGAKSCGMTTVLVDRRLPHTEAARGYADIVVTNLSQIPELAFSPHMAA